MKKRNRSVRLGLVLALLCAVPAAAGGDGDYASLRADVMAFRKDDKARKFRHNYAKQVRRMRQFAATHPDSDKADDALYIVGQLLDELYAVSYVASDLDDALAAYEELANRYPQSNLADDALFRVARLRLERRGDKEGARTALETIVAMDGAPDFGPRARELLSRLPAPPAAPATSPPGAVSEAVDAVASAMEAGLSRQTAGEGPEERVRGVLVEKDDDQRAVRVKSVKLRGKKAERRVDVRLSGQPEIKVGVAPASADKPKRMFYDLRPAKLPVAVMKPLAANTEIASRVRAAQYDEDTVRVVVELEGDDEPVVAFDEKKHTLSLALTKPAAAAPPVLATVVAPPRADPVQPKIEPKAPAAVETKEDKKAALRDADVEVAEVKRRLGTTGAPGGVSISQQMGLEVRRVVIDAGHGGKDTGAVGPSGLKEKDVTLAIAKTIRDKLKKKMPQLEVILTRDNDTFVELKDRTDIANNAGADLFISIHANANPSRRVRGVETYYLNITHDRYAMRLAARENRDAGGDQQISDLEFILADLAMKSNVDDSIRLGRHVQSSLIGRLRKDYKNVDDHGLKHALFYVLLGSRMPAILVETSFISNRVEEKRLGSKSYREAVADGVVKGVTRFVAERQAFARR